jgi:hypothetical protein
LSPNGAASGSDARHRRLWRWLLVLPLAYGVCEWIVLLPRVFDTPGQDASYYLGGLAIVLTPALVYTAAAVLVLSHRQHRLAWLVLLACGVGLILWYVAYTLRFYPWDNHMVLPIYVTVLATARVVWSVVTARRQRQSATGETGLGAQF